MNLEIANPGIDLSPYAPPKSDISQPVAFDDHGIDFRTLKKLRSHSISVRSIGLLGALIGIGVIIATASDPTVLAISVLPVLFAVVYSAYARPVWGRILGIVFCMFLLLGIPIGTILGIAGLVAYGGGSRLFGDDRLTHKFLESEWKRRKKLKI